ncbi:cysteine hydrolase [Blautia schinkii]|nr:cysteine hydrolase [Blautia schinkii]
MKKALFVIDMQEICVGKNHADFFNYEENLVEKVNNVIDKNKEEVFVVYIRNVMKKNLINKLAPFHAYDGSPEAALAENLHKVSDLVFDKYTGDAFTNERLKDFLKTNNITCIEIVGVDGGGCVSATALGAIENGYTVILNTAAIGTTDNKKFQKKRDKYFQMLKERGAEFI